METNRTRSSDQEIVELLTRDVLLLCCDFLEQSTCAKLGAWDGANAALSTLLSLFECLGGRPAAAQAPVAQVLYRNLPFTMLVAVEDGQRAFCAELLRRTNKKYMPMRATSDLTGRIVRGSDSDHTDALTESMTLRLMDTLERVIDEPSMQAYAQWREAIAALVLYSDDTWVRLSDPISGP